MSLSFPKLSASLPASERPALSCKNFVHREMAFANKKFNGEFEHLLDSGENGIQPSRIFVSFNFWCVWRNSRRPTGNAYVGSEGCPVSNRTREHDFKLEGLMGFDFHGRTAGVLGTGRIGQIFINLCLGFGMRIVCYDKYPNKALMESGKVEYTTMDEVWWVLSILARNLLEARESPGKVKK